MLVVAGGGFALYWYLNNYGPNGAVSAGSLSWWSQWFGTAAGARYTAGSPLVKSPDGGYAWVFIYSFATPDEARTFMKTRSDAAQCSKEYTLVAGNKDGQYDGFNGKAGEGRTKWSVQESRTVGGAEVQSADDGRVVELLRCRGDARHRVLLVDQI